MTNMVDAAGTTKYTYKPGGLVETEDGPWASDMVTNLYNSARLRRGLVLVQPTGTWTNGFTYDAAHRMSNVVFSGGTFSCRYKGPGNLVTNLSLPNTAKITNAFDNVGRLTGTYLVNSGGTVLNKHEYLYNAGNQRIRHTRTDGSYYTNTYDNIGQLKVADGTLGSEDRGYLYDAAWNLSQLTNNGSVTAFNVNVKNELTSATGWQFTYDNNGNLTYYGTNVGWQRNFTYDAENQLASVQVPGYYYSTYTYDGRGRRRQRVERTWNGSSWVTNQTVNYVYDGMRVIQERDGSNVPTVSYTRGRDLSGSLEGAGGIGGLLARSHGYSGGSWGTHNYYHADGGGNITMLIDASQVTVASYRYDPYGNTVSSSGGLAAANLYRFSSKEINVNYPLSGLYYYGYRWYDPNLQRWLNRDPLGDQAFIISQLRRPRFSRLVLFAERNEGPNLYRFVRNNPLTTIDALGLFDGCVSPYGPATMIPRPPPPPDPCISGGGHYEPYWKVMGYADFSACATAEWNVIRDGIAGIGVGIIGGIIGGSHGATIGGGLGTMGIPSAICALQICVP